MSGEGKDEPRDCGGEPHGMWKCMGGYWHVCSDGVWIASDWHCDRPLEGKVFDLIDLLNREKTVSCDDDD